MGFTIQIFGMMRFESANATTPARHLHSIGNERKLLECAHFNFTLTVHERSWCTCYFVIMRLKVLLKKKPEHSELASCVGWNTPDEVYSSSDDHQVLKSSLLNGETTKVCTLPNDVFPTDIHWFPKLGGSKKQAGSDIFAMEATNGTIYYICHTHTVLSI